MQNFNNQMSPAMNVYEKNGRVFVETAVPGMDAKNIKVEINGRVLTVSGSKNSKSEVDEKNYFRQEISFGSFFRSVILPAEVDESKVEAVLKDGLLKISAPASKSPQTKKQDIKVEEE
jgi:HSP20 family protein